MSVLLKCGLIREVVSYKATHAKGNTSYQPTLTTGNISYKATHAKGNTSYQATPTTGNLSYKATHAKGNTSYQKSGILW
jgi:hypothetical protein